ncbi:MAG: DUF4037 domain-containing protein [Lachnospiraceae bacterium]|nr:DUF4037 domain-containing protein [Lachnospiraceae bacterium]
MTEQLFAELSMLNEVEAIALGGSRAGENYDESSDYDVYLYCTAPIPEQARRELLEKYCSYMEIGNHYWEYEDNCTLNNGIDIDILYRNLDDFANGIAEVVEQFQAHNGYTTCMWHNLKTCKIIYDKQGRLEKVKKRFDVPYPEELRENIITQNMNLLNNAMPAYSHQIEKAVLRGDRVSVLHRTTAFLESYFDILFAVNRLTHPGEKRLVGLCKKNCSILPEHFEENLNRLFDDMGRDVVNVREDVRMIVDELNKLF